MKMFLAHMTREQSDAILVTLILSGIGVVVVVIFVIVAVIKIVKRWKL